MLYKGLRAGKGFNKNKNIIIILNPGTKTRVKQSICKQIASKRI